MSALLARIQELAGAEKVRVSAHGYDELADDDLTVSEILRSVADAASVEEYPDHHKGPCMLALQKAADGRPIHVLWGMSKAFPDIVTLVTAYRPDADRWTADFLKRKPR